MREEEGKNEVGPLQLAVAQPKGHVNRPTGLYELKFLLNPVQHQQNYGHQSVQLDKDDFPPLHQLIETLGDATAAKRATTSWSSRKFKSRKEPMTLSEILKIEKPIENHRDSGLDKKTTRGSPSVPMRFMGTPAGKQPKQNSRLKEDVPVMKNTPNWEIVKRRPKKTQKTQNDGQKTMESMNDGGEQEQDEDEEEKEEWNEPIKNRKTMKNPSKSKREEEEAWNELLDMVKEMKVEEIVKRRPKRTLRKKVSYQIL